MKSQPSVAIISAIKPLGDTHTQLYVRTLIAIGCRVTTICPGDHTQELKDNLRHIALPAPQSKIMYSGPVSISKAITQRILNCSRIAKSLELVKPDICISIEPDSWCTSAYLKPRLKHKVVANLRELYDERNLSLPAPLGRLCRSTIRFWMKILSRRTDEIIHVSHERKWLYRYLRKSGIVICAYPELVRFGISDEKSPLPKVKSNITLIHAGPLRRNYAAAELLAAMKIARDKGFQVKLIVLGGVRKGDDIGPHLETLVQDGAIEIFPSVCFEEVVQHLQNADAGVSLVLPVDNLHYYAQPRKLYEYLAAGIPVLGADVPTIRRVIESCGCGLVVDPESPESIAEAIQQLTANGSLRHQLGKNARYHAEKSFNWEREAERLKNLVVRLSKA